MDKNTNPDSYFIGKTEFIQLSNPNKIPPHKYHHYGIVADSDQTALDEFISKQGYIPEKVFMYNNSMNVTIYHFERKIK